MNQHIDSAGNSFDFEAYVPNEEEVAEMGQLLFSLEITIQQKKITLIKLAHVGTEQACNILRAYKEYPDEELRFDAQMAFDECCYFALGELLANDDDSDDDMVFTGVGKKNNMMRMYYMVLPQEGQLFEAGQHDIIRYEMSALAKKLECEGIEWFDFQPHYVGFSLLQSLNVSVSAYIDTAIEACNVHGDFVFPYNYAGTGTPTANEIDEIINFLRNGDDEEEELGDAKPCEGELPF